MQNSDNGLSTPIEEDSNTEVADTTQDGAAETSEVEGEEEEKKDPTKIEIQVSEPAKITCQEDLEAVLKSHQLWMTSVLHPRKEIVGGRANLSGVDLSEYDLSGVNLRSATLTGAKLCGADLSGADLSAADLSHADLQTADLSGTILRRSNLEFADLRAVDTETADLRDAKTEGTQF